MGVNVYCSEVVPLPRGSAIMHMIISINQCNEAVVIKSRLLVGLVNLHGVATVFHTSAKMQHEVG